MHNLAVLRCAVQRAVTAPGDTRDFIIVALEQFASAEMELQGGNFGLGGGGFEVCV